MGTAEEDSHSIMDTVTTQNNRGVVAVTPQNNKGGVPDISGEMKMILPQIQDVDRQMV